MGKSPGNFSGRSPGSRKKLRSAERGLNGSIHVLLACGTVPPILACPDCVCVCARSANDTRAGARPKIALLLRRGSTWSLCTRIPEHTSCMGKTTSWSSRWVRWVLGQYTQLLHSCDLRSRYYRQEYNLNLTSTGLTSCPQDSAALPPDSVMLSLPGQCDLSSGLIGRNRHADLYFINLVTTQCFFPSF